MLELPEGERLDVVSEVLAPLDGEPDSDWEARGSRSSIDASWPTPPNPPPTRNGQRRTGRVATTLRSGAIAVSASRLTITLPASLARVEPTLSALARPRSTGP